MEFLVKIKEKDFKKMKQEMVDREWIEKSDSDEVVLSKLFLIEEAYHFNEVDLEDKVKIVKVK